MSSTVATEQEIRQRVENYDRPAQDLTVFVIAEFQRREGIDLSADVMALPRVREAAQKVWFRVMFFGIAQRVWLPYIASDGNGGSKHLDLVVRNRNWKAYRSRYV